ncbi:MULTISPECIES: carbohydrate porin [unclassified Acidocella]|uniref:carbohydrate porin n=1 Tax=unclassified Acidocella TaxID=2648610 RepID=UPI00028CA7D0|nr:MULTISPECIES: carbohydrate porin [unclassified Acidocella]EKM99826.1 carbohydrate-selective porin OprB [Acidocella sp. MX-AZ02]WBO58453.1 carbohydrate porin [Acidocella sp. MX-AZ03]
MKTTYLRQAILSGVASLSFAVAAHAQTMTQDSFLNSLLTRKTMTGDWNGGRTRLKEAGLTFKGFYDGNFADAVSGGKRTGNGYAQQLGIGVDADMGKLFGLEGGTLSVGFNQRQGRSVSSDFIGNRLAVQEVYGAGETLRVTELSYTQNFAHGLVQTKAGFYPMGNDFAGIEDGCDFMNVGFCAHAQNLPASSGWSDYPTGKWGGRIKLSPTPSLYIETGIYDVNPGYYQKNNGLKVSTSGSTGALIPLEAGYKVNLGGLPGLYKVGAYYDTSDAASVTNASDMQSGRYGFYAIANQMLVSFGGPKRGLIAIGMVSYSDPSTALFQGSVLGGLIAQGPFAARPQDFIDVGYVRAILNKRVVDAKEAANATLTNLSTGEGVLEIGYGFQATPWLQIHPNVQYVMDPGTFSYSHIPNAWAFGLQVKATL